MSTVSQCRRPWKWDRLPDRAETAAYTAAMDNRELTGIPMATVSTPSPPQASKQSHQSSGVDRKRELSRNSAARAFLSDDRRRLGEKPVSSMLSPPFGSSTPRRVAVPRTPDNSPSPVSYSPKLPSAHMGPTIAVAERRGPERPNSSSVPGPGHYLGGDKLGVKEEAEASPRRSAPGMKSASPQRLRTAPPADAEISAEVIRRSTASATAVRRTASPLRPSPAFMGTPGDRFRHRVHVTTTGGLAHCIH